MDYNELALTYDLLLKLLLEKEDLGLFSCYACIFSFCLESNFTVFQRAIIHKMSPPVLFRVMECPRTENFNVGTHIRAREIRNEEFFNGGST